MILDPDPDPNHPKIILIYRSCSKAYRFQNVIYPQFSEISRTLTFGLTGGDVYCGKIDNKLIFIAKYLPTFVGGDKNTLHS